MRCPECKKFSKEVRLPSDDGKLDIYSDCVKCGRIFIERIDVSEAPIVDKKTNWVKVFLGAFFVLSAFLSGFLYYRMTSNEIAFNEFQIRYLDLYDRYDVLLNTTSTLNSYYDELRNLYSVLREEYSNLENQYVNLLLEKNVLEGKLNESEENINFEKSIILDSNKTIELSPNGNATIIYNVSYAGLLEVNFSASSDVFIWVGCSMIENCYYARYPSFPKTSSNGSFKIPVCATVYINVNNPNEEIITVIFLSIEYIY